MVCIGSKVISMSVHITQRDAGKRGKYVAQYIRGCGKTILDI